MSPSSADSPRHVLDGVGPHGAFTACTILQAHHVSSSAFFQCVNFPMALTGSCNATWLKTNLFRGPLKKTLTGRPRSMWAPGVTAQAFWVINESSVIKFMIWRIWKNCMGQQMGTVHKCPKARHGTQGCIPSVSLSIDDLGCIFPTKTTQRLLEEIGTLQYALRASKL